MLVFWSKREHQKGHFEIKNTAKDTNEKEFTVKKTPMKPTTAAGAKPKMRGNHKKVHKLSPAFASILGETHMIWNEACREIWRYIKVSERKSCK